jgi:hypothetical protein
MNIKKFQKRLAMVHLSAAVLMVACNSGNSFDKNLGGTADTQWLNDVESCIGHLQPSKNKYVYGDNRLDCTAETASTDCSGFVNNVAQAYFPAAYNDLITFAKGRPSVSIYYQMVSQASANSSITPVASMSELAAGDIIMWIYKGAEKIKLGATGHMMLVLAPADEIASNQYRLFVADSADSGHDQDTRGPHQTGLGMGYIYFKTNANGFPIAYSWDNAVSWKTSSPIQLGHFVD